MKWIVGLGNPGSHYERTRHNVGFMAVDLMAKKWSISMNQSKFRAQLGEGNIQGTKVMLIKPQTFMNLSGESLRAFMDFYKADLNDLIVIYDDLDTALGLLRLRYQGSPGGHNGVKSIVQHLGTQVFNRIRIGISRPPAGADISDYVLSVFSKSEQKSLEPVLEQSCEALAFVLQNPFDKAMAKFNGS